MKTNLFHKPTTYERHILSNYGEKITFARYEYGQVGVFRIKIRSLVQKLQPLEKCQSSKCFHLIESHCRILLEHKSEKYGRQKAKIG